MAKFIVAYGKFVDDKDVGIILVGVYLGGVCDTQDDADTLATKCVSETQGGIIVTKVIEMRDMNIVKVLSEIEQQFDKMAEQIYDNERTIAGKRDFDELE